MSFIPDTQQNTTNLKPSTSFVPDTQQPQTQMDTLFGSKTLSNFAEQVGGGALSTISGLSKLGGQILSPLAKVLGVSQTGEQNLTQKIKDISEQYKGTPGYTIEQLAEFLTPVGIEKKGLSWLSKAILQGTEFAEKTAIQTGGELPETITSGILGTTFPVAGKLSEAVGLTRFVTKTLPERFYNTYFKTALDDFTKYVKTGGLERLRTDNPEMFSYLRDIGVVRKSILKNGKVEINPTLAQEAIEKGMGTSNTGRSLENMAEYSYMKQYELEGQAQKIARTIGKVIQLTNNEAKSYIDLLQNLQNEFKKLPGASSFMREQINKIGQIRNRIIESIDIASEKGSKMLKLDASTALTLRRELDILRNSSSFITNPKLGSLQGLYKNASEKMRAKIAQIPELAQVMDDYRFYIESGDSLVRELATRTKGRILGLQDAILGGQSMAGGFPAQGVGLATAARIIQLPAVLTMIARGLYNLPKTVEKLKLPGVITGLEQQIQR